ncbi:MAG: DUF2007 domain-containing protein [Bacteroidota bacterium]|nr:DUF2007 domain-containing protein [Bacteroidota bacterium]
MKNHENLIVIFSGSLIQVEFVKEQFEEHGIDCIVKNEFQEGISAGYVVGTPTSVDIYVREEDYEKAIEILKDLGESPR